MNELICDADCGGFGLLALVDAGFAADVFLGIENIDRWSIQLLLFPESICCER